MAKAAHLSTRLFLRQCRRHRKTIGTVVGCGLALNLTPLGGPWERFSFDFPFRYQSLHRVPDVALVFVDEGTLQDTSLFPTTNYPGYFHRQNHALLLDALHETQPRLVVYDFIFAQDNPESSADVTLARALRRSGNVVLAATYRPTQTDGALIKQWILPNTNLLREALGLGFVNVEPLDSDDVVRRLPTGEPGATNITWVAANIARLERGNLEEQSLVQPRWLRYYDGHSERAEVIPTFTASEVALLGPDVRSKLRDRIVVVGARGLIGRGVAGGDEFGSPYQRFAYQNRAVPNIPGAEILATSIQNLLNRDWLSRIPPYAERALTVIWGLFATLIYLQLRWRRATGILIAAAALGIVTAVVVQNMFGWWFPWAVPFVAQTFLAWFVLAWTNPEPGGPPVAFISYRRGGGSEHARLIRGALRERRLNVFLDVTDLGAGAFDEQLRRQIAQIPSFILVLAPGALDRCAQPGDVLREEIQQAIQSGVRIIPVLVKDFAFPPPENLPGPLAGIPRLQSLYYSHEDFDGFIQRLAVLLGKS